MTAVIMYLFGLGTGALGCWVLQLERERRWEIQRDSWWDREHKITEK